MMNVHIRSRPYNCRYGCNMAYNDVSNRNSHEKKKHGGLFQTDPNPNPSQVAVAVAAAAPVTLPNLPHAVTLPHPVSVSLPIAAHGPHPSLHLLAAPAPGPARPF